MAMCQMPADLLAMARAAKGFMPDEEGLALHVAARRAARARIGDLLEVGAYCGKSTLWLGAAAREEASLCWSVDHHRGSEENQVGWEHHDPSLVDVSTGRMDTLPAWRRSVEQAGLEPWVVAVVGDSPTVAARWGAPLALVLIDGGHGVEPAWADYRGWEPHVAVGGVLAIHDVFPDPAEGGRPPYEIWRVALASGRFEEAGACGSLRLLLRAH
ncbi:MAG: class I SAM-dependent methyltransferase [Acidimicrobiales bacterium]